MIPLDLKFVRQHFPAFDPETGISGHFFDSAAGSFPCIETIDSLHEFYQFYKVQPGNHFPASAEGMARMLASKNRWAEALGVYPHELGFGPSTSQNTYVLARAFAEILNTDDEVIVTNQDHESNTGALRRAVKDSGATLREWCCDPVTGLLDIAELEKLLSSKTSLICFPHASNIAGHKNDVKKIVELAKSCGARTLVDGVSYVPHDIPDIAELGADIYVFSLYKVYSVHLGVMVVRDDTLKALPKQYHFFKSALDVNERLVPAGPDHAQIGAAGAVLDYIETLAVHHGNHAESLRDNCKFVSTLWRNHEMKLVKPLLDLMNRSESVRLIGSAQAGHERCPLVSFAPTNDTTDDVVHVLTDQNVLVSNGHFYAPRLLKDIGIDPDAGVVRISMTHYNSLEDVSVLISKLEPLL